MKKDETQEEEAVEQEEQGHEEGEVESTNEGDGESSNSEDDGAEGNDEEGEGEDEGSKPDYRAQLNISNRILKKEGYEYKDGKWVKKTQASAEAAPTQSTLSPTDVIALTNAKVHEDDVDEVLGYSAYRKISIAKALKDPTLKTILSTRAEERQSSNLATTKSPRGASKVSGETLIDRARKGEEVKEGDIDKLVAAELEGKGKS